MFGISTHLYVSERLDRDHLVEVAAHGFEAIELFALREHFDYRDRRAAVALAEWLDAVRAYQDAESIYVTLQAEVAVARAALVRAIGAPLTTTSSPQR